MRGLKLVWQVRTAGLGCWCVSGGRAKLCGGGAEMERIGSGDPGLALACDVPTRFWKLSTRDVVY